MLGVIAQVRAAASNLAALVVGCMLGGFVPLATYFIAHREVESVWSLTALLVVGGLTYSAKTVWQWAHMAFDCKYKATGFVLLLEGVMVLSHIQWLALSALAYLTLINAVATGCKLAQRDSKDTCVKERKARAKPQAVEPASLVAVSDNEQSGARKMPSARPRKSAAVA